MRYVLRDLPRWIASSTTTACAVLTFLVCTATARADVYPPAFRGGGSGLTPHRVERHWSAGLGWARPDDQGTTNLFDSGPTVSGGLHLPVSRDVTYGLAVDYGYFPVGAVRGAIVHGDPWHTLSIGVESRWHAAVPAASPDLRLLLIASGTWSHLRFGETLMTDVYGTQHSDARSDDGYTLSLGIGAEYLPEERRGFFADARIFWFAGSATYTWYPIRVGVLFPWPR